ncbi:MAG: hypothetical protein H0T84_08650 [Tatlockia sp.]|nr:hypothetical protein [Tatlockia sp.]
MISESEIKEQIQILKKQMPWQEELSTLQNIFDNYSGSSELVNELETFLADRWEFIKAGKLPSYTDGPTDDITKLMMKTAKFAAQEANENTNYSMPRLF